MSAVAFLGDECSTLHLTPQLRQLHDVYYEPLAAVQPSLEALLAGEQCRGQMEQGFGSLQKQQVIACMPGSGCWCRPKSGMTACEKGLRRTWQ